MSFEMFVGWIWTEIKWTNGWPRWPPRKQVQDFQSSLATSQAAVPRFHRKLLVQQPVVNTSFAIVFSDLFRFRLGYYATQFVPGNCFLGEAGGCETFGDAPAAAGALAEGRPERLPKPGWSLAARCGTSGGGSSSARKQDLKSDINQQVSNSWPKTTRFSLAGENPAVGSLARLWRGYSQCCSNEKLFVGWPSIREGGSKQSICHDIATLVTSVATTGDVLTGFFERRLTQQEVNLTLVFGIQTSTWSVQSWSFCLSSLHCLHFCGLGPTHPTGSHSPLQRAPFATAGGTGFRWIQLEVNTKIFEVRKPIWIFLDWEPSCDLIIWWSHPIVHCFGNHHMTWVPAQRIPKIGKCSQSLEMPPRILVYTGLPVKVLCHLFEASSL